MKLLVLLLAALPMQAGYLQCAIVDWDTGRSLARTTITLEAVQNGQTGNRSTLRTDRVGVAMFGPLADGIYIMTASRAGFATQQAGQKGWNRPGTPIVIQGDPPVFIQMRLRRLAAISGAVWDENQVGLPGVPVVVYTSARPPKIAARAITDDRGIYRVGELTPGTYFIRNAAKVLEDGLSIIPTFHPGANSLTEAHVLDVDLDHSPMDINFQAAQGRLFRLSGNVVTAVRMSGTVDLISDMGRTSAGFDENGAFSFPGIAPGTYDLSAQNSRYGGWARLVVDRDMDGVRLNLVYLQPVRVRLSERDNNPLDTQAVKYFARRKDLDADGAVMPLIPGRTQLTPGIWEIAVSTAPTLYPFAVTSFPSNAATGSRADGWNAVTIASDLNDSIRVVISSHPASLHGHVSSSVPGAANAAPVFLETMDLDPNEPPQVRTTRTDQTGNYAFAGLPPGRYHVVSSYDLDITSRSSIETAGPRTVSLKESANETQDLELSIH